MTFTVRIDEVSFGKRVVVLVAIILLSGLFGGLMVHRRTERIQQCVEQTGESWPECHRRVMFE
ncbi:hypothetical protein HZA26_03725 [Candidatus Nomurabacteria bacterium]|nr:hypothetical protein [Candidatus Nomurabacteria bacterium]